MCPRQESNLHPALRRRVLCPLSYEGQDWERSRRARFIVAGLNVPVKLVGLLAKRLCVWYLTSDGASDERGTRTAVR